MNNSIVEYGILDEKKLYEILSGIKKIKIAMVGDVCLDVYWRADMKKSLLSRETPHFPLPVVEEDMSPGAGGNVAANLCALNPLSVSVISVIGKDWRGRELAGRFESLGISTQNLIQSCSVITNAYCKPMRKGISDTEYEDPRLDFENYHPLPEKEESLLIASLENISREVTAICVSDQFAYGCITQKVREKLSELSKRGIPVIADSRERAGLYKNVILKPNEVEGLNAAFPGIKQYDADFDTYLEAAKKLSSLTESKICMTLGKMGCIYYDGADTYHIKTPPAQPPLDICGAGDTFMSAFMSALATGAKGHEACAFANIASGITIKKIGMTGTASSQEILDKYKTIKDGNV